MTLEQELVEAGDKLFEALKTATPEEKEVLRSIGSEIERYHNEQTAQGKVIDRSALFAAGIITHEQIQSETLRLAAKHYLEVDYMFVRAEEGA
ncbi:MAG: hypothetical protein ACYCW6_02175 [Candidatus Xenobia bacterium]